MNNCYPVGEQVDSEGWSGGVCLIDDGSCYYCDCGFHESINWDPGGNYTVDVLLPLMCGISGADSYTHLTLPTKA